MGKSKQQAPTRKRRYGSPSFTMRLTPAEREVFLAAAGDMPLAAWFKRLGHQAASAGGK